MSFDSRAPLCPPAKPLLIVLSGLSGVGKDSVLSALKKADFPVFIAVTATTRAKRPGEKEGVDYYFVSPEKFQEMKEKGELLEFATVYDHNYGPPAEPVRQALKKGQDVILRIDVQGAQTIKKKVPQAVLIFMVTTNLEELEQRLKKRKTETVEQLELRLKTALSELDKLSIFDYIVVNREGKIDQTIADIRAIIAAEKCRVAPREINL
ncbi:MAG TPA: guanylate kinase [Dehalococcoidales bacterium]|nr:guanylate kinase [Dehalococcoidales bacterium]